MAADTGATGLTTAAEPEATALAGLDNLELQQAKGSASDRARKIWGAVWPKLLAIAIVLGAWELIHLSGWKNRASCPGRLPSSPTCGRRCITPCCGRPSRTTMRRAVIGFGLALVIGVVVGALVSRIKPLRAAVGSMITALQTMPSIAWFPFAIILFGVSTPAILFVIVLGAAPSIANGLIVGGGLHPAAAAAGGPHHGAGPDRDVPAPDPARLAALVRGRPQAGLGLRLAQPDGRRTAGDHPRPAVHRRAALHRPGPERHGRRHLHHDRDPGARDSWWT